MDDKEYQDRERKEKQKNKYPSLLFRSTAYFSKEK